MGKQDNQEEDRAIQDTLSMTTEQRLEMLAALIVEKIAQDIKQGSPVYEKIGASNG